MTDQAVKSYEHGTNIQAHGYKLNSKFGSLSTTDRLSLLFIILLSTDGLKEGTKTEKMNQAGERPECTAI